MELSQKAKDAGEYIKDSKWVTTMAESTLGRFLKYIILATLIIICGQWASGIIQWSGTKSQQQFGIIVQSDNNNVADFYEAYDGK